MIHNGEALAILRTMESCSVDCCVTSPPYFGLRDYGSAEQIGVESSVEEYIERLVEIFREVRRVLKDDGTLWLNLGDSYAGSRKGRKADGSRGIAGDKQSTNRGASDGRIPVMQTAPCKQKDLIGVPWMVAFALRADGWYLRSDIVWEKPNAMPESVKDRPTRCHEYIFLLAKSKRYHYDADAIKEPAIQGDPARPRGSKGNSKLNGGLRKRDAQGISRYKGFNGRYFSKPPVQKRNKRDVWRVSVKPYKGAHFATFPPDLIEPCILAGAPVGGVVLDPFAGSGTTGMVAQRNGREFVGIEINANYCEMAREREAAGRAVREMSQ